MEGKVGKLGKVAKEEAKVCSFGAPPNTPPVVVLTVAFPGVIGVGPGALTFDAATFDAVNPADPVNPETLPTLPTVGVGGNEIGRSEGRAVRKRGKDGLFLFTSFVSV